MDRRLPPSRDRVVSSLNVFEWKFWRVDFHCDGKTRTSYLVRPAGPPASVLWPPVEVFVRTQSLQLFHLLWSKRFAQHVLQDPNDKMLIKFIDYFQPPFPGKVFFVFSEWLARCFHLMVVWSLMLMVGCYFRWSLESFPGLVRDEQINLGWQFKQIWMLPHDPWEWTTRSRSLDSFQVFLLFCTMVNYHQTSIWENIFGTCSKHLQYLQQIQASEWGVFCSWKSEFIFSDLATRLPPKLTWSLKWDPRKKRLILETTSFRFQFQPPVFGGGKILKIGTNPSFTRLGVPLNIPECSSCWNCSSGGASQNWQVSGESCKVHPGPPDTLVVF